MTRPSLDLTVVTRAPDGTEYRHPDAHDVSFKTARMDGFKDGTFSLPRSVLEDRNDVTLAYEATFVGADGDIAYEGFIGARPGSTGGAPRVDVQVAGFMALTADRKVHDRIIDRSPQAWTTPPLARRIAIIGGGFPTGKISASASAGGLVWDVPVEALPANETSELHYDAGPGEKIAVFEYAGERTGAFTTTEAPTLFASDTQDFAANETYTLTLDGANRSQILTSPRRFLMLRVAISSAVTPAAPWQQRFTKTACIGDHGITLHVIQNDLDGVYGSDIIRYLANRYAPQLDTTGVLSSGYPIPHQTLDGVTPYDGFKRANQGTLWGVQVWERKRLEYRPADLTDYDWQVRTTDPGVTWTPAGTTLDDLANGIDVTYTDVLTGARERLNADEVPDLRDLSPSNPYNQAGRLVPIGLDVPYATTEDYAIQLGRVALAEHNLPKYAGTISIRGHVKDRAGQWQPAWKIRACDRLAIVDHPNDTPRLVVETDYSDTGREMKLAVGLPFSRLEALMDRTVTRLQANGFG